MQISVVVPTYHRHDMLRRCLMALAAQRFDAGAFEVIVADDAADVSTRRLVETEAAAASYRLRYLPVAATQGPAAARNAGWRAAEAEFIAFTDDDCLPQPGWLASGVEALTGGADAAWGRLEMPLPPRPTDYQRDAAGLARAVFVTANCFCRRAALEQVGGFDERFTAAWREDSDLYFSLLEHRCRIVHASDALVIHPIRPAPWGVSLRQQRKSEFDALLFKKHPGLYRRHIAAFPRDYYYAVGSLAAAVAGVAARQQWLAFNGLAAWGLLTGRFFARRMRGNTWAPAHVAEMLVTSMLIPPLSIFWRMHGALKYRSTLPTTGDRHAAIHAR
ncbi:MAG TPA: glycosyltransferase [Pirellulales bacterium]|nr:glycosyltransferase [Pirellulales bacterium]